MGATVSVRENLPGCNGASEELRSRDQDRLHFEFEQQLAKSVVARDGCGLLDAREEIARLRFLLSCSNAHFHSAREVNTVQGKGEIEQQEILVPLAKRAAPGPREDKTIATPKALQMLGASFGDFLKEIESSGKAYKDSDFPPSRESLASDWAALAPEQQQAWAKFEWKRMEEIWPDRSPALFEHGISPKDVHQGGLGDCYLLSALAVLAEHPDRIKKLFLQSETSKSGAYGVQLCYNGAWKTITVDDYVPFNPEEGGPAFARPNVGAEKWVCLLEKAWAKVNGSYQAIEGGITSRVLRQLTGCRTEVFDMEDPKLAWDAMVRAESKQYVVTAEVGDVPGDLEALTGIVERHAYAILGVYTIPTPGNPRRQTRLLQIRNPWGRVEWTGDWSDSSKLWTSETKALVGWSDADDGIFHMSLLDFAKVFEKVVICHVQDDLAFSNSEMALFCDNGPASGPALPMGVLSPYRRACVKLTVHKEGSYTLGLHQPDKRAEERNEAVDPEMAPSYDAIKFWITKLPAENSLGYNSVGSSEWAPARDVYVAEKTLTPGEYLCFATSPDLVEGDKRTFVMSAVGPATVEMSVVHAGARQNLALQPDSEWRAVSSRLFEAYEGWCEAAGKASTYAAAGHPGIVKHSWTTQQEGVVVLSFKNGSKKTLHESIKFSLSNLALVQLVNATVEGDAVEVEVKPGETALIVLEQIRADDGFSYSYGSKYSVR